jgi:hypothetical protein
MEKKPKPIFRVHDWQKVLNKTDTPDQVIDGKIELVGDGWTLTVEVTDDGRGLYVSTQGTTFGAGQLIIESKVSNGIAVYNDTARAELICEEAERLREVEKANRRSPLGPTRRKKK